MKEVSPDRALCHVPSKRMSMLFVTFTDDNFQAIDSNQDDLMVITIELANFIVMKTLVD